MQMLPPNSSVSLRQSLLDRLWRQWTALGVAGAGDPDTADYIDIEALVLITTSQGRYDSRLFDEMLDWLWSNGNWVNLQRLRNLQRQLALGDLRVLAAVADFLGQRAVLAKWKPLAKPGIVTEIPAEPEPLFLHDQGKVSLAFGATDPVFLRWGFQRGPYQRRGLSHAPNPRLAANLQFKLRALFGVQARCEVVLWLLSHPTGRPADIARAACYFSKTVEGTLTELVASGLVREVRSGRERHCAVNPREWEFLRSWDLPAGFPAWVDWARRFAILERTFSILSQVGVSDLLRASELRRVMEELQPVVADGGLVPAFASSRQHTGTHFTAALVADLEGLLGR